MQLTPEQQQALEAQKAQCPFCKIIKGEIPSKVVYEDEVITAILDINPANKGHLLVMPKEHYPILPLIPPQTFESLAVKVKQLSKAVKEGMLVFGDTVFIANGAAAGQQSQHFMLHIIPREENDGLSVFEYEKITVDPGKEEEAFKILKYNLPKMMKDVYARFPLQGKTAPSLAYSKEELIKIINMNPQLKQAIIKNPSQFKQMIPQNPQLKELFANIDVDDIIETVTGKKMVKAIDAEFNAPKVEDVSPEPDDNSKLGTESFAKTTAEGKGDEIISEEKEEFQNSTKEQEEGEETQQPNYYLFNVLDKNPVLKSMLINNLNLLKQKMEEIPELKETFGDVDLTELRKEVLLREQKQKSETEKKDADKRDDITKDDNEDDGKSLKTKRNNEHEDDDDGSNKEAEKHSTNRLVDLLY
ncbi:HIT domain-containing protein [Candidatus Woesearchaeota archaeon]|nr:HIT domain-containing protein [Candidatus Woesearchaeota archaeon]